MRKVSRWFGLAGLVVASGLIGWVARSTAANNLPRPAAILPAMPANAKVSEGQIPSLPACKIVELAQAPADQGLGQSDPVILGDPPSQGTTPAALVPPPIIFGKESPKSVPSQPLSAASPEPRPLSEQPIGTKTTLPEGAVEANPPTTSENEDPAKAAQDFVEQNQKVAETQLKNLRDEEAKLRARLQKVEAAIKRWEALVSALNVSATAQTVVSSPNFGPRLSADPPEVLDPIPKSKIVPPPATVKQ
jgi:hypothetical protein